jgi:undecaprenyl-diphosphatase
MIRYTLATQWDLAAVQALYAIRTPFGVQIFSLITDLGGAVVIIAVMCMALVLSWEKGHRAYAAGLIVSLGGAMAASTMLKFLVERPRPPMFFHAVVENGYSFPSNHSTAATALYAFLAYSAWKLKLKFRTALLLVFTVIILAVGFSRVYLGVHYPSDILGGYGIGGLFVWLGTRVVERLSGAEEKSDK